MTGRNQGRTIGWDEASDIMDLLAHDLGNSAQAVLAKLEISSMGGDGQDVCADIGHRVEAMHRIVCNVRTALRAMNLPFRPEKLDMGHVIASARDIAIRATGSRPAIDVMLPEGGCEVIADGMLKDALGELIANSVDHGGPDTRITIEAARIKDAVRIVHVDSSEGVDLEAIGRSLQRLDRLISGGDHNGSGTGLAMVKAVVDRYGGSIRAGYRVEGDPDSGLRIVIDIPAAHPRAFIAP